MTFIYIIIADLFRSYGMFMDGFGRAIARWNRLVIKMIMSWERIASRAPHARSARKCVFLLHKAALNGHLEACIANKMLLNCR